MKRTLDLAGNPRQLLFVVLMLAAMAVIMSACDSGTPATTLPATPIGNSNPLPPQNTNPTQNVSPTQQPSTKVNEVGIILNDSGILPNNMGLPPGKIRFKVTNQGNAPHDLVISNSGGGIGKTRSFTKADGVQTLDVTLQTGTYTMASDVPGDADKGITGTLDIK